jgi:hypothetical protein
VPCMTMAASYKQENRILAMQEALADACERALRLQVIKPREGDLPFTVLFRRPPQTRYPSLAESGWHIAANVPWLALEFADSMQSDPAVKGTMEKLAATSALGAGFVDPYYGVPIGLKITDTLGETKRIMAELELAL